MVMAMSMTKAGTPAAPEEETGLFRQDLEQLDNEELLLLYKETGDNEAKWALVMRFREQIRRIALRACGIYNGFSQLDDIIHEGILVLLNAVDRFDPAKGVKLETYVSKRLKGMIIDLSRKQDWMPRQLRQKSTQINRAMEELSVQLGRTPSSQEMADYLGMSQAEYEKALSDTAGANLLSFEMLLDSCGNGGGKIPQNGFDDSPEERYEERELHEDLTAGIQSLRPNEQLVLSLYYEKELTMKEIAQVMGVSPPRVSQIHSHAIQRLRVFLKEQEQ